MTDDVQQLIAHFGLTTLPSEGMLFTSTYRSAGNVAGGGPEGTAMIGLYCNDPVSHSLFHRLPVDEVWHFYAGDPIRLILLHPDGSSRDITLGGDPLAGQQVQFVVPAGVWQAGHLITGGRYALFGCTMAPGFSGAMYEGGTRRRLLEQYADRIDDIEQFGCEDTDVNMPVGFAQ